MRFPVMFIEEHTGLFWFLVSILIAYVSCTIADEQISALLMGAFILTCITTLIYLIEWLFDAWDTVCDWVNK